MDKSVFEAKDTTPSFTAPSANPKYAGPEQRRINRRDTHERRGEVRFELDKLDRRQRPGGRRSDDVVINFV